MRLIPIFLIAMFGVTDFSFATSYCKEKVNAILSDAAILNADVGTFDRPKLGKNPFSDGKAIIFGKSDRSEGHVFVSPKNYHADEGNGEDSSISVRFDNKNFKRGSLTQGSQGPFMPPANDIFFKLNSDCEIVSVTVESTERGYSKYDSLACQKSRERYCKYVYQDPRFKEIGSDQNGKTAPVVK